MHNVLKTSKHRLGEGAETEDMCKLQRRAPGRYNDDAELQSDERYSFGYEFVNLGSRGCGGGSEEQEPRGGDAQHIYVQMPPPENRNC